MGVEVVEMAMRYRAGDTWRTRACSLVDDRTSRP
jgi:hypothetical protein